MDLSALAVAGAWRAVQIPIRSGQGDIAAELVKEAFFLRMLSGHPFICQHHETLIHSQMLLLVFEYCEGGDLESFLNKHGPMAEEELLHVMFSMALAIRHCHRRNVAHRDIKPANIFRSPIPGKVVYKVRWRACAWPNIWARQLLLIRMVKSLVWGSSLLARAQVFPKEVCSRGPPIEAVAVGFGLATSEESLGFRTLIQGMLAPPCRLHA
jgi:serine/threonine protein kinase